MAKKIAKKTKKKTSKKVSSKREAEKKKRLAGIDVALALVEDKGGDEYLQGERELVTANRIQLPNEYLSFSQIEMYIRCPKQYEYRYIHGKKSAPAVALEEGSSHHKALEHNNCFKIKHGEDMSPGGVIELFSDDWSDRAKEIEDWGEDNENTVAARGKKMIRGYMGSFAPLLKPEKAEQCTAVPVGPDVTILGYMDVIGHVLTPNKKKPTKQDPTTIVDYKTVGRARSQNDVTSSLQLAGYSHANWVDTGEDKVDAGFCCLVKTNGLTKWVKHSFGPGEIMWFRRVALSVANQISLGNFPLLADPTGWACSERFCGFWDECKGKALRRKVCK